MGGGIEGGLEARGGIVVLFHLMTLKCHLNRLRVHIWPASCFLPGTTHALVFQNKSLVLTGSCVILQPEWTDINQGQRVQTPRLKASPVTRRQVWIGSSIFHFEAMKYLRRRQKPM